MSMQCILRISAMDDKSSVKASLKSIFKRSEREGTGGQTDNIIPLLRKELQKLEVLKSSGGLTARQDDKYTKIRQALALLEGEGTPVESTLSDWQLAHRACQAALATCQQLVHVLQSSMTFQIHSILELHLDELQELRPLLDHQSISALDVMSKLYDKAAYVLGKSKSEPSKAEKRLHSLSPMLQDGPEYLMNLALLKAAESQSKLIDSSLADEVRMIRRDVTKNKAAPDIVIAATLKIRQDLLRVPNQRLRALPAAQAFQQVDTILDKLQARLGYLVDPPSQLTEISTVNDPVDPAPSVAPMTSVEAVSVPYPKKAVLDRTTPVGSNPTDIATSKALASIARRQDSETPASEATSTAPRSIPTPQTKSRSSPIPESSNTPEPELYEYGGHILTRSALSLVMLQERMDHADSSGQYAGEVQWDPVRQTWIPVYVRPLQKSDVGEGEVPDRNPANFEVREEDEFGNRIGWSGDQMYYLDDPVFEIRHDD